MPPRNVGVNDNLRVAAMMGFSDAVTSTSGLEWPIEFLDVKDVPDK
jgi:hypothetical protein